MEKQRQTNPVLVRVTDSELRRIKRVAGREPLATWARRVLLEHCERREKRSRPSRD